MTTRRLTLSPPLIALLLAVGLFFLGGVLRPGFASTELLANILRLSAFLGLIAAGQTLVIIGGGEGIDLSVGAVVTLAAVLVFRISGGENSAALPAVSLALAAGAVVGVLNGLGVTLLRIPPLVMTLGMTGVVQGLILAVTQGEMLGATPSALVALVGQPLVFGMPAVVALWLLLGIGMWLLLERTGFGRRLFAIGVNRTAAHLSGVHVPATVVLAYTLSGLLAALGGVLLLGYTQNVFLSLGAVYTLPSVAAVVIGGTLIAGGHGSYWGTMAGALVLTVLTSLLTSLQMPEAMRQIIYGTMLLALLLVYGRQSALRQ